MSKFNSTHLYMKTRCLLVGISLIFLGFQSGFAQQSTSSYQEDICRIRMINKTTSDSIVLRWALDHAGAWDKSLVNGFILERAEIPDDSTQEIKLEKLGNGAILPLPKESWKLKFNSSNKMAALAASQIYASINPLNELDPNAMQAKQNLLLNRHGFTLFAADRDAQVAQAAGLRFVDRTFKKGKNYLYRIYFSKSTEGIYTDTALLYVNTNELSTIPLIRTPAVTAGDQKIELRWDAGTKSRFSAYNIERSDAGKKEFKQINDEPLVSFRNENRDQNMAYFSDSIPNYQAYEYRIVGLTAFGELSEPSMPIHTMAIDLTPPNSAVISSVKNEDKSKLRIQWIIPSKSPDADYLLIARSMNNDGPFLPVSGKLSLSALNYLDENPDPHRGNFYVVLCYDTAGNISKSLPFYGIVQDDSPPAVPLNLSGYIDTTSVIHLNWNKGLEPDLQGYRVYYSNSPEHEFSNITPQIHSDTTFKDTIEKRTLTKHIYYRIVAVDNNYNHSKMAPWIKIRRLDVIPPVSPIFNSIEVADTAIYLSWNNSSSDDVKAQMLYRKTQDEKEWKLIKNFDEIPFKNKFIDREFEKKKFYKYRMLAMDSSNLVSEYSPIISVRTFDNGLRKGIADFKVTYDQEKRKNVLTWNYNEIGDFQFVIYRANENQQITKYKLVKSNQRLFEDDAIPNQNSQFQYAIKVIYKNGGESKLSDILKP